MSEQVFVYPSEDRVERWQNRAEQMDVSISEFIQNMTEAGLKKFDANVTPDESVAELHEQRNNLRKRLQESENRIEHLENRLDRGERAAIREFVEENPGAEYADIFQHLQNTTGSRISDQLASMEGEELTVEDGQYYYFEEDD